MSLNRAKEHLKKYNLEDKIITFDISTGTVTEAANALKCTEAEIAKTLSFRVNDKPILIVMSGSNKIDNAKFKATFKEKAHMLCPEEVENLIGHKVGGVCPFGINTGVKVYLDISLKQFETVYPAAGTDNTAVKLTLEELEKSSEYTEWVDVSKGSYEL